jgi:hypothetical protein
LHGASSIAVAIRVSRLAARTAPNDVYAVALVRAVLRSPPTRLRDCDSLRFWCHWILPYNSTSAPSQNMKACGLGALDRFEDVGAGHAALINSISLSAITV